MSNTLLKRFSKNITQTAEQDRITPLIGRYEELEKISKFLLQQEKNNLILVGEHGVGKTAIVQGFAKRIMLGKVPEELADKQIISLDVAALDAGDKFRERFKTITGEIQEAENVILFIDDIHDIWAKGQKGKGVKRQVGSLGNSKVSKINTIDVLKKAFVQGKIQCIAATTPGEYRKKIEQDPELRKQFQTIVIDSPSLKEAYYIVRGLRHRYENRHKLLISTKSLRTAVELSDRYFEGQPLLVKAVDVIDRACYRVRLKNCQDEIYENIQGHLKAVEAKRRIAEIVDNEQMLSQLKPREAALQLVLEERTKVTPEHVAEVVSNMTGILIGDC